MNKGSKIAIGLALSVFFLWLALRNFDADALRSALREASYGWIVPAVLLFSLAQFIRSIRWSVLLAPLGSFSPFLLFPVLVTGMFANNVVPARGGEVIRALAANRVTGLKVSSCLGSIVVERVFDLVGLLFVATVAAQLLPSGFLPMRKLAIMTVIGGLGLTTALFLGRKVMAGSAGEGFTGKIVTFISNLLAGFAALRSPARVLGVVVISLVVWSIEILQIQCFSRAFHLDLSIVHSAALLLGLCLGVMLPAAPGYVGTYEFFGQRTLVLLGVAAERALPFVLILHFMQFVTMAALGIPSAMKVGWKKAA